MKTSAHYHIGIDAHKRFSQVHVLADDGSTAWKGRIENNDPAVFEGLVRILGGPLQGGLREASTDPASNRGQ